MFAVETYPSVVSSRYLFLSRLNVVLSNLTVLHLQVVFKLVEPTEVISYHVDN